MTKIKTSELTGPALDWAVATVLGRGPVLNMQSHGRTWHGWWLSKGGEYERMPNYSTDWAQGGPTIEREWIKCDPRKGQWEATIWNEAAMQNPAFGPTPLIAAMRCYVASKWGDEVDIPEELQ